MLSIPRLIFLAVGWLFCLGSFTRAQVVVAYYTPLPVQMGEPIIAAAPAQIAYYSSSAVSVELPVSLDTYPVQQSYYPAVQSYPVVPIEARYVPCECAAPAPGAADRVRDGLAVSPAPSLKPVSPDSLKPILTDPDRRVHTSRRSLRRPLGSENSASLSLRSRSRAEMYPPIAAADNDGWRPSRR